MNVSETLLRALRAHGAGEVFGIPGDFVLPFFQAIEDTGILPLYTLSHEPAVGFAADAAARSRPGLGVAAVTYGAGALNMVNAVAAAYAEKSPVVVVSGAPGAREAGGGLLLHHQAKTLDSQWRIFAEVTCAQARLDDPRSAPTRIAETLRACLVHSRPVYLELPRDMALAPCAEAPVLPEPALDPQAVDACADDVLARLRAAASPVLLVDVEVRRYGLEAAVAELARRLGAPVAATLLGHGLLAGSPVLRGTYLGVAGDPDVTALVEGSDALFMLGVVLSDTNLGVSARRLDLRQAIRALDGEVSLGHHLYRDIPLGALVTALLQRLPPQPTTAAPASRARVVGGLQEDDAALEPMDVARAVNDLFAATAPMPVAADVGDCLFVALDIEAAGHCAPAYYATMGFGVPAALGIQAATGRRPLALVGDGAFQMTGWELGNCARYGWDPIVVVLNNGGWQMLRALQPGARFTELGDWQFAAAAEALGGDAVRVRTRAELAQALRAAQARRGRFQLVEAMLPAGAMSPALARYAAAAGQRVSARAANAKAATSSATAAACATAAAPDCS